MTYITGDKHGRFDFLPYWCEEMKTSKSDILIILGDTGLNYFKDNRDDQLKESISKCPITLFCIRGNHEERPCNVLSYRQELFHLGVVFVEDKYPNIKFAEDGSIFSFDGSLVLAIGGAYSVDKQYRLDNHFKWFESEQLNELEMTRIAAEVKGMSFDYVLTHTCPISMQPTYLFLGWVEQSTVDNSMEKWLEEVKNSISYKKWYFGHYHDDRKLWGNSKIMFGEITKLGE